MKKTVWLVTISITIGWVFHFLYGYWNRPKVVMKLNSSVECAEAEDSYEVLEKIVTKEVIKFVPQIKIVYRTKEKKEDENGSKDDLFVKALNNKKFYEAMSYYEDAEEEKHPAYQTILFGYFNKGKIRSPREMIEQMQYFIEMESTCKLIIWQLSQLFEEQNQYENALDLIVDFSYLASYEEKKMIELKIKTISLRYITKLTLTESFMPLIDFLRTRMNLGILSEFYAFELAKVYLKIKKYLESQEILLPLSLDEHYKERALEMLTLIDIKLEELEEYPIQIPLMRSRSHFYVKAHVESTSVLLMIDTGASTTVVDYALVNHLEVFKENATFHTAGGKIHETIFTARNFSIGEVRLEDFHVVGSSYPIQGFNGLLGMNFLGKFKFKIDQKEAILFLGKKY